MNTLRDQPSGVRTPFGAWLARHSLFVAGWVCWLCGMATLPLLVLPHVYVPLFICATVLGLVAVARGRPLHGLALILASTLVAGLLFTALFGAQLGHLLTRGAGQTGDTEKLMESYSTLLNQLLSPEP